MFMWSIWPRKYEESYRETFQYHFTVEAFCWLWIFSVGEPTFKSNFTFDDIDLLDIDFNLYNFKLYKHVDRIINYLFKNYIKINFSYDQKGFQIL